MAPDGGDTICPCVRNDMDDREKIFGAKKIDFKVENVGASLILIRRMLLESAPIVPPSASVPRLARSWAV